MGRDDEIYTFTFDLIPEHITYFCTGSASGFYPERKADIFADAYMSGLTWRRRTTPGEWHSYEIYPFGPLCRYVQETPAVALHRQLQAASTPASWARAESKSSGGGTSCNALFVNRNRDASGALFGHQLRSHWFAEGRAVLLRDYKQIHTSLAHFFLRQFELLAMGSEVQCALWRGD